MLLIMWQCNNGSEIWQAGKQSIRNEISKSKWKAGRINNQCVIEMANRNGE